MKTLAVAILIGLSLIAGAIVSGWRISAPSPDPTAASSWAGYENVVRNYFVLARLPVEGVKHVAGPYYTVRYESNGRNVLGLHGSCALVDLSKSRGVGGLGGVVSVMWVSGGPDGAGPSSGSPEGCGGKSPPPKSSFPDLGMGS
jgi:hypothetical protein